MCDLFLLVKDVEIASYANDNMSYIVVDNIDQVTSDLQNASASLFNSPDKYHLLTYSSMKVEKKRKRKIRLFATLKRTVNAGDYWL